MKSSNRIILHHYKELKMVKCLTNKAHIAEQLARTNVSTNYHVPVNSLLPNTSPNSEPDSAVP